MASKGGGTVSGSASLARTNHRGENVITVIKRTVASPDGATVVEAEFNLDAAPVPDRRYAADAAFIIYEGGGEAVHLIFGQKVLGFARLRSVVDVKVYPDHVRKFLRTCEGFEGTMTAFLARAEAIVPNLDALKEEPQHVVSLVANVIAAGYAARESVLDFYHYNALALRKLNSSSDLALDTVVRIDLPTTLLAAVLNTLNNLVKEFPPEITQ